jgi:hypothetical protein
MTTDLKEFLANIQKLNKEVETRFTENTRQPIYDGPLHPEEYFKSRIKIMWLMKEPYDEANGEGGGWGFDLWTTDEKFRKGLVFGGAKGTWQPAVYTTYGIQNNFMPYDNMNFIRDDHSMIDCMKSVAWVNIQKLPSKNTVRTVMDDVYSSYNIHKDILKRQLELLSPDIVICANTLNVIKDDFDLRPWPNPIFNEAYTNGRTLFINTYHPAQRTISRKRYIDGLIDCIKLYMQSTQN